MSFTAYFRSANWQFPSGITYLAAGWTYIQFFAFDRPPTGYKEISQSEFKATPVQYLQDPEHHRVRFPKVPGQSTVTDNHTPHAHHH